MFLKNVVMCFFTSQMIGEAQASFGFCGIIACHLNITLLGQATGTDWRAGLGVGTESTNRISLPIPGA